MPETCMGCVAPPTACDSDGSQAAFGERAIKSIAAAVRPSLQASFYPGHSGRAFGYIQQHYKEVGP
jgi:hypothetical protein